MAYSTQPFFDDALSDKVFVQPPDSSRAEHDVCKSNNGIFNSQMLADAVSANGGYAATFKIGVQIS